MRLLIARKRMRLQFDYPVFKSITPKIYRITRSGAEGTYKALVSVQDNPATATPEVITPPRPNDPIVQRKGTAQQVSEQAALDRADTKADQAEQAQQAEASEEAVFGPADTNDDDLLDFSSIYPNNFASIPGLQTAGEYAASHK